MIELSPGKGVYIYESHITKAYSKQTATATARFLLSCFYNDEELIGKSLTGKNGKQCLGIQLPRHQADSPPANSPPRNDLATNVLATKRSLLATNHQ